MEYILIGLFIAVLLLLPKDSTIQVEAPKVSEKKCPPHKWSFVEVKDSNGEVTGTKLTCAHCGPLHNGAQE